MGRNPLLLSVAAGLVGCSPVKPPDATPPLAEQLAHGKTLYQMSCAPCHREGEGSPLAPPLRGSGVVTGPPAGLARLILKGQNRVTVVDGEKFNGMMPAQAYLTDTEIAAVTAYVREAFGGQRESVAPKDIAPIRKE